MPEDIRMTVSQELKSGLSGAIGVSGSQVFSVENESLHQSLGSPMRRLGLYGFDEL